MVSAWHVAPEAADAALDGWDAEARVRDLARDDPRYWSEGEAWMTELLRPSDA